MLPHRRQAPVLLLAPLTLTLAACVPVASPTPRTEADTPHHRRGIEFSAPFLAFRGRAEQMGDVGQVSSTYRLIAVDADPGAQSFTAHDLATLQARGRNLVLGILDVGFCDRRSRQWSSAPDGYLPCVANLSAQIGERRDHPQEVWMSPEDYEYQRLIVEDVAPRIALTGVDGFLLDGLELLDHGDEDVEAPCDADCQAGALVLLEALRREFPNLVFLAQGGLSRTRVLLGRGRAARLLDGVIGEGVYAPSYSAAKEAELVAWQAMGLTVNGRPFAVITQDYVKSCDDVAWAQSAYEASRSHGFVPAVGLAYSSRPRVCPWQFHR